MRHFHFAFFGILLCLLGTGLQAQPFTSLDFNESSYNVTNKLIGALGVTYTMTTVANNNGSVFSPVGNNLGDLEISGDCGNCGRTVRITFSQPVDLLISGKQNTSTWFSTNTNGPGTDDGFWKVSSTNGTFTLSDPASQLQDLSISPNSIAFNGKPFCSGGGATACQAWSISSNAISSLDVEYEANSFGPNGSAIRFRISDNLPAVVPTLSQWGLIILGLSFLSLGAIVILRRRRLASVA